MDKLEKTIVKNRHRNRITPLEAPQLGYEVEMQVLVDSGMDAAVFGSVRNFAAPTELVPGGIPDNVANAVISGMADADAEELMQTLDNEESGWQDFTEGIEAADRTIGLIGRGGEAHWKQNRSIYRQNPLCSSVSQFETSRVDRFPLVPGR